MIRTAILLGVLCAFNTTGQDWSKLNFVFGRGTGVAGAQQTPLGVGQGGFSFEFDLDNKVIVRRDHAARL